MGRRGVPGSVMDDRREELTRLGLFGLLPLAIPAIGVWLAPWALPMTFALDLHQMALAYSGVLAAFFAGTGFGAALAAPALAPGRLMVFAVAALAAWFGVWQGGLFTFTLAAAWRYGLVIAALIFIFLRERRATAAGVFPGWYGAIRLRFTYWAIVCLIAIASRLIVWGYY